MTNLDTKAIRGRAERATGGRWVVGDGWFRVWAGDPHRPVVLIEPKANDPEQRERDARFIAHARTDVPALCDALDAARAELNRQTAAIREVVDEAGCDDVFDLPDAIERIMIERDAARAELAQAKQQRKMLREALKKWERADDTPMSHPDFDVRFNEARTTGDAALDGTKETA